MADDTAELEASEADARLLRRVGWRLVAFSGGSTLVVLLVLGIALAAARNRRMRTTGRLLLVLLAVVFATASLVAGLGWLTALGVALSAATGLLAIFELL